MPSISTPATGSKPSGLLHSLSSTMLGTICRCLRGLGPKVLALPTSANHIHYNSCDRGFGALPTRMENENRKDNGEIKEQLFYETNIDVRAPSQNSQHGTSASD